MSVTIMSRVWKKSKAKGNHRLVLLGIADNAHDDGTAYSGIHGELHRKTLLTGRAISDIVSGLAGTGELVVYPNPGRSHDFIVTVGMEPGELKAAVKTIVAKRGLPMKELHDLRKAFLNGQPPKKLHGGHEAEFMGVMKQASYEPSITINESSEPKGAPSGAGTSQNSKSRPRDFVFEWVLKFSHNITYRTGAQLPKAAKDRANKAAKAIKEINPAVTEEELKAYAADYPERFDNISPIKDDGKLVLDIMAWREWKAKRHTPVDDGVIRPGWDNAMLRKLAEQEKATA